MYLPDSHPFTAKVVFQAHIATIHRGIVITMAKVRERSWVPRLRRLTKKIMRTCHGCKRFRTKAYRDPREPKELHHLKYLVLTSQAQYGIH
jgi:hypothetical protein